MFARNTTPEPNGRNEIKYKLRTILNTRFPEVTPADVHEVMPQLYLGNEMAAKNVDLLRKLGITHVLNTCYLESPPGKLSIILGVATNKNYYNWRDFPCDFKGIGAIDTSSFNIKPYFEETSDFIDKAIQGNGKIFVHCVMGVSRSATIVIAYLMMKRNYSLVDAMNLVKSKRNVYPNDGFQNQLIEFEEQLRQKQLND